MVISNSQTGEANANSLSHQTAALQTSEPQMGSEFGGINALIATAHQNGVRRPKIRFWIRTLGEVRLSVAGVRSRSPGAINVTDAGLFANNKWYGRVTTEGDFVGNTLCTDQQRHAITTFLKLFARNPGFVSSYLGRQTRCCCFCGLVLTDEHSLLVGRNQSCSEMYGLPWDEKLDCGEQNDREMLETLNNLAVGCWDPTATAAFQDSGIRVGQIVRGRVTEVFRDWALILIAPGVSGSLQRSQMSHTTEHCCVYDLLAIGQEVDVTVQSVKRSKKSAALCIALSRLDLITDPWPDVEAIHPVGMRCVGTVRQFVPFGAIVELPSGFTALLHESEISWTARKPNAVALLSVGEELEVVVTYSNAQPRKLHVSCRQVQPDPWETLPIEYPFGSIVEGVIKSVKDYGIFVTLPSGCAGLLHLTSCGSTEGYKAGQSIRVAIGEYNKEEKRLTLKLPSDCLTSAISDQ